jgi:hypothetical protein
LTTKPSKVLIIGSGDITLTFGPSPIKGEGKVDSRFRGNDETEKGVYFDHQTL